MFFQIGRSYGFAEVYARKDNQWKLLKPHEIFKTRFVGYDNFRRNVLSVALDPRYAASFCRYLFWRLPQYEAFTVAWVEYPDLIETPDDVVRQPAYRCEAPTTHDH
ncbi:MAG: hypothetical protein HYY57_07050 [Candidatus Omnitrophica bacterium]|nr:hypothetical protein [Candidatus Omnitrophota bacterium]